MINGNYNMGGYRPMQQPQPMQQQAPAPQQVTPQYQQQQYAFHPSQYLPNQTTAPGDMWGSNWQQHPISSFGNSGFGGIGSAFGGVAPPQFNPTQQRNPYNTYGGGFGGFSGMGGGSSPIQRGQQNMTPLSQIPSIMSTAIF